MTPTSPARPRPRTWIAGGIIVAAAVAATVVFAQAEQNGLRDDLASLPAVPPPVTATASLGSRPSPQIQFVGTVGRLHPALVDGQGWEAVLDAAEHTCVQMRGGGGDEALAQSAAERFGGGLIAAEGLRLVEALRELRVCASFGLA